MPFWSYMLHCADRTFYVGHTDDLEKRIGEHELGLIPGYTASRRPVKLVWSDAFGTRAEAKEAERQLKGWGRKKKLALIRGDWALVSKLAQGKKEGPSTSSGKPVSLFLHPHPDHLPSQPFALEVVVRRGLEGLKLRYRLTGDIASVRVPGPASSTRADDLWRHTCFEAFIKPDGDGGYLEFNFAPSTQWAAYRFASYREGMRELPSPPPEVTVKSDRYSLELTARADLFASSSARLNLTAIVEEVSGHKSYWALAHPPEGPPDFHHPACVVLELPPPNAP